jgi:myo-inositol-1(or 4)-monophosphatase
MSPILSLPTQALLAHGSLGFFSPIPLFFYLHNYQDYRPTIEYVPHELYGKVSSIRINGSSAMSLCYVAAGRFEGWMEAYIGKWDFSAGALIVMEAGGQVTDFTGNEHFIDGHHIIATNGYLHQSLLQLIKVVPPKL